MAMALSLVQTKGQGGAVPILQYPRDPGFLIAGFNMGRGAYCVMVAEEIHEWSIDHHIGHVDVTSFGDTSARYVPGPRETELRLKMGRLDMADDTSFAAALARLAWTPDLPHLKAARGQAGLIAVMKDLKDMHP